jgi:hypothetical protein
VSTIEDILERKSSSFGLEIRDYSHRGSATQHTSAKVGTTFADKRRLLDQYCSLANSGHKAYGVVQAFFHYAWHDTYEQE